MILPLKTNMKRTNSVVVMTMSWFLNFFETVGFCFYQCERYVRKNMKKVYVWCSSVNIVKSKCIYTVYVKAIRIDLKQDLWLDQPSSVPLNCYVLYTMFLKSST